MQPEPNKSNSEPQQMDSESIDPVEIPPTVYSQIEALRQSGVANMITEVRAGLRRFEFIEAAEWIEANPGRYAEAIHTGYKASNPDAVDEIDPELLAKSTSKDSSTSERDDASTDREQRLLNHLEGKRHLSEQAETYYSSGTWRDTAPLSENDLELVDLFDRGVGFENCQCYRNALMTVATFGDTHDIVYVEGYVMADALHAPIDHAWIELDGKVVEITFPDGPHPGSNAVYLGVEFSVDAVKSKVFDEKVAEPLTDNGYSEALQ